jgi:hypothetical protein
VMSRRLFKDESAEQWTGSDPWQIGAKAHLDKTHIVA